jgi:hypothetical protein
VGEFAAIWQEYHSRLGCPVQVKPADYGLFAEQAFEDGFMFWADNPEGPEDVMLVVTQDGEPKWYHPKNWSFVPDGSVCADEFSPPAGRYLPVRGFGGVWCDSAAVQKALGWATEEEHASGGAVQRFTQGFILRTDANPGKVFTLFEDDWTYEVGAASVIERPTATPPDASIAFISGRQGGSDLHIMSGRGEGQGGQRPAVWYPLKPCDKFKNVCLPVGRPSFQPGTDQFLFHATVPRDEEPFTDAHDLFLATLHADHAELTTYLTPGIRVPFGWEQMQGTWSPDGNQIAYLSTVQNRNRIWIMNADASDPRAHTPGQPFADEQPAWQPESGEWIAVTATQDGDTTREIHLVSARDGAFRVAVTRDGRYSRAPAWSPDGQQLAFLQGAKKGEPMDVCIVNLAGWLERADTTSQNPPPPRCLQTPDEEDLPAWSPDGNWIAFQRRANAAAGWDVYKVDAALGQEEQLTFHSSDDWGPAWREE